MKVKVIDSAFRASFILLAVCLCIYLFTGGAEPAKTEELYAYDYSTEEAMYDEPVEEYAEEYPADDPYSAYPEDSPYEEPAYEEELAEEPVEEPSYEESPAEEPVEEPSYEESPTEEPVEEPVEEPTEEALDEMCEPPAVAERYREEEIDANTTKITEVLVSYDYVTYIERTVKDVLVGNRNDFEATVEDKTTMIDQYWDYESCAWENTAKYVDSYEGFRGYLINQIASQISDYSTAAYSWSGGEWVQDFESTMNTTAIRNKDAAGVWEAYVFTETYDGVKTGTEATIDPARLDAQGRPMYQVESWYDGVKTSCQVTRDEMPPEPCPPPPIT